MEEPETSMTEGSPATTTVETPAEETTSTEPSDSQGGFDAFSLQDVNESIAFRADESERASFANLTDAQQELFLQALECDCNIKQEVFRFNDKERIRYVEYNGSWYYLRVAIVRTGTTY
jgi:hypothetical protein